MTTPDQEHGNAEGPARQEPGGGLERSARDADGDRATTRGHEGALGHEGTLGDLAAVEGPRSLDPRVISYWRLWDFIGLLIFLVAGLAVGLPFALPDLDTLFTDLLGVLPGRLSLLGVFLLLVVVSVVITYRWPATMYRHQRYQLDADGLEIHRGVFWKQTIYVPTNRVQHTDVNQGPMERQFGLAHLVIHTAGTTSASVQLLGLAHGEAMAVRNSLVVAGAGDAV